MIIQEKLERHSTIKAATEQTLPGMSSTNSSLSPFPTKVHSGPVIPCLLQALAQMPAETSLYDPIQNK